LDKRGVKVEYGKNLVGVNQDKFELTVKDVRNGKSE
jgi:hypothetical protein